MGVARFCTWFRLRSTRSTRVDDDVINVITRHTTNTAKRGNRRRFRPAPLARRTGFGEHEIADLHSTTTRVARVHYNAPVQRLSTRRRIHFGLRGVSTWGVRNSNTKIVSRRSAWMLRRSCTTLQPYVCVCVTETPTREKNYVRFLGGGVLDICSGPRQCEMQSRRSMCSQHFRLNYFSLGRSRFFSLFFFLRDTRSPKYNSLDGGMPTTFVPSNAIIIL